MVVQAPSKNGDVQVKVGPLSMKTKLDRLRKVQKAGAPGGGRQGSIGGGRQGSIGGGGGKGGKIGQMNGKKKGNYKQLLAKAVRYPPTRPLKHHTSSLCAHVHELPWHQL